MTPTPPAAKLKWIRAFISYARYELQPGESKMGDQFPRQADADKAMAEIDAVSALLASETQARQEVEDVLVAHGRLDGATQADRVKWLALDHEKVSELLQQSTGHLTVSEQARARAEQQADALAMNPCHRCAEQLAQAEQELAVERERVSVIREMKAGYIERMDRAEHLLASLRTSIEAFMTKWELVLPAINSATMMAHIHGATYSGPTIGVEIEAMRLALSTLQARERTTPQPTAEALRALTAKWRAEAAADKRVSFCADELDALLTAAAASAQTPRPAHTSDAPAPE